MIASNVKQRGDQVITSEDDLVAPSIETEVFTSKENQLDTKKNEVDDKIGKRTKNCIDIIMNTRIKLYEYLEYI